MSVTAKQRTAGWIYLMPATLLIAIMSFYPMFQALFTSFKTGSSAHMKWADPLFYNYVRMFRDKLFIRSLGNTFLYLIIEVPIMLILAILLAQLLNNKDLRFKGFFRTCVFLPCATSLVSYSLIFKSLFATNGLINSILVQLGIFEKNYNFLGTPSSARAIIILALIWRWTGYNMVFYLAGLQNIEYSVYEAAKIDGANGWKTFWKITVPLLKPTIIMLTLLAVGRIFYSDFGLFYQVPQNQGALFSVTNTIDTYVYRGLLESGDMAMSSAAGLYQSIVGFILVLGANLLVRKIEPDSALF